MRSNPAVFMKVIAGKAVVTVGVVALGVGGVAAAAGITDQLGGSEATERSEFHRREHE